MEDKIFVVAIGGTGMRCLESFVHLCAIGMFDNKEIDILTLDTDQSNGNKKRVEDLVDHYVRIKTPTVCSYVKFPPSRKNRAMLVTTKN